MKKFIVKFILFVAVIVVPFSILNGLYKNTNYWKSSNETYELRYYPDGIALLNLGNSHEMAGFCYGKFYRGVSNNFATSSQPFYYSHQVLKSAEESIADGAVVLIPISCFDWYYNWRELFGEIRTYNNRYYSFLKPWQICGFNMDDYIECGVCPLFTAKENVKYIFQDINLPDIEYVDNSMLMDNGIDYANEVVDYKYNSLMNDVMDLGPKKDRVYEQNKNDMIHLIDYCYTKGYRPVLLSTPVTSLLNDRFSEDFKNDFDEKNQEICRSYPDLLFLDYSKDKEFTDNLQYFRDSDHMNSYGGDAYTERVLSDLVKAGMIDENDIVR